MRHFVLSGLVHSVAAHLEVDVDFILADVRFRTVAEPRFAAWLIAERYGFRPVQIGRAFRRDHATIYRGLDRAKWLYERRPEFRQLVADLEQRLADYTRRLSGNAPVYPPTWVSGGFNSCAA